MKRCNISFYVNQWTLCRYKKTIARVALTKESTCQCTCPFHYKCTHKQTKTQRETRVHLSSTPALSLKCKLV